jgi:hypothetical protein
MATFQPFGEEDDGVFWQHVAKLLRDSTDDHN